MGVPFRASSPIGHQNILVKIKRGYHRTGLGNPPGLSWHYFKPRGGGGGGCGAGGWGVTGFTSHIPLYRGGKNFCREKLLWEKFCPKFRDSIFPASLMIGTEFFPANLRIVEFCLHKESNYRQNPFKNFLRFASVYIFSPSQLDGTVIFPWQNKDWDRVFPSPVFQNFAVAFAVPKSWPSSRNTSGH
jgi:hypothetical protein